MKKAVAVLMMLTGLQVQAETHGGVIRANEKFEAVYKTIMKSDIMSTRLGGIRRVKECKDGGSLYQISLEYMDKDGIIKADGTVTLKVDDISWDQPFKITQVKNCL